MRRLLIPLIGIFALGGSSLTLAQRTPAIPGHTGVIALPDTVDQEYKAANKIVVAAEDGVEHAFPAGKGPLSDLTPGSTVAIYSESKSTEGTVTDVDRDKSEISVRYANGTNERLTLAEKEAVAPGKALQNEPRGNTRVVVYYSDAAHGRIARYFKPKS
ncbi:MAG TPA: hypothetical protein VG871_19450 [Vicinamibacterales bacterium]|nr:hypothetical protein [Vicinamibacterales bacterium]